MQLSKIRPQRKNMAGLTSRRRNTESQVFSANSLMVGVQDAIFGCWLFGSDRLTNSQVNSKLQLHAGQRAARQHSTVKTRLPMAKPPNFPRDLHIIFPYIYLYFIPRSTSFVLVFQA